MTSDQKPEALKPCPFCGGQPDRWQDGATLYIGCPCLAAPQVECRSTQRGVEVNWWNTRAPSECPFCQSTETECSGCGAEITNAPSDPYDPDALTAAYFLGRYDKTSDTVSVSRKDLEAVLSHAALVICETDRPSWYDRLEQLLGG